MKRTGILVTILLAAGAARAQDGSAELADPALDHVPRELLVKFRDDGPPAAVLAAARAVGAQHMGTIAALGVRRWRAGEGLTTERALEILAQHPAVEYAEPNYYVRADVSPDDPARADLWALHNLGQTGGAADADIDALEAWQARTDASGVIVGVIDTGVDYGHPELSANMWVNPGEDLNGNGAADASDFNGADDDGNGHVDDLRGWDFANGDNDPMDDNGHGTHVAGTIGARGNNGNGVAGVCWAVRIMPLKFLGAGGTGDTADAASAVSYAASFTGASAVRITSNSWGGGSRSKTLERAIANSNALFVAAAGNSGSSTLQYPGGYPSSNVISVAATDHADGLASFSNYGTDWVDLGAPGVKILSTLPGGAYGYKDGTSMATPHVSGAAALVLAHFPSWSNQQVKDRLLSTGDAIPSLAGKTLTGRRLNVGAALGAPALSDTDGPLGVTLAVESANAYSVTLSWDSPADDAGTGTGAVYLYDVRYSPGPLDFDTAKLAQGEPVPAAGGTPVTFAVTGLLPDTTYEIALRALDEAGNPVLSNVVTATTTAPAGGYRIEVVNTVATGTLGAYNALAYDTGGAPSVAFTSNSTGGLFKFGRLVGGSWVVEGVPDVSPIGMAHAYAPDGVAALAYGWMSSGNETLNYARREAAGWSIERIPSSFPGSNEFPSLAYDAAGRPSIAYRGRAITQQKGKGGGTVVVQPAGLKLARFDGSAWSVQLVDPTYSCRYVSLAYDPSGNPAIAYSDDLDGNNTLDALKFARWNGSSWDVEVVESGAGFGVAASLCYDGATATVAHAWGSVRYLRRGGAAWALEVVDPGPGFRGTSLAYDGSGTAYLSYWSGSETRVARRNAPADWQSEIVDASSFQWHKTSLGLAPDGQPSLTYFDSGNAALKYARKAP